MNGLLIVLKVVPLCFAVLVLLLLYAKKCKKYEVTTEKGTHRYEYRVKMVLNGATVEVMLYSDYCYRNVGDVIEGIENIRAEGASSFFVKRKDILYAEMERQEMKVDNE